MSRPNPRQDTPGLLRLLRNGGFEFGVVGGVAAVMHGATQMTFDLDVIAPFNEKNIGLLFELLAPYKPTHLTRPDLPGVTQPLADLVRFRSLLLSTSMGRLDVLREMPPIGAFEDCLFTTRGAGDDEIKVLALDQLIALKKAVARPKDLLVAAELEALPLPSPFEG